MQEGSSRHQQHGGENRQSDFLDSVFDPCGLRVSHMAGIRASEVGSLRHEEAIGIVCNFTTLGGSNKSGEGSLRSFALARQFFPTVFKELASTTGADLENIVYTKGDKSHYFVMTPSR